MYGDEPWNRWGGKEILGALGIDLSELSIEAMEGGEVQRVKIDSSDMLLLIPPYDDEEEEAEEEEEEEEDEEEEGGEVPADDRDRRIAASMMDSVVAATRAPVGSWQWHWGRGANPILQWRGRVGGGEDGIGDEPFVVDSPWLRYGGSRALDALGCPSPASLIDGGVSVHMEMPPAAGGPIYLVQRAVIPLEAVLRRAALLRHDALMATHFRTPMGRLVVADIKIPESRTLPSDQLHSSLLHKIKVRVTKSRLQVEVGMGHDAPYLFQNVGGLYLESHCSALTASTPISIDRELVFDWIAASLPRWLAIADDLSEGDRTMARMHRYLEDAQAPLKWWEASNE
jgi:hypothetical protein